MFLERCSLTKTNHLTWTFSASQSLKFNLTCNADDKLSKSFWSKTTLYSCPSICRTNILYGRSRQFLPYSTTLSIVSSMGSGLVKRAPYSFLITWTFSRCSNGLQTALSDFKLRSKQSSISSFRKIQIVPCDESRSIISEVDLSSSAPPLNGYCLAA